MLMTIIFDEPADRGPRSQQTSSPAQEQEHQVVNKIWKVFSAGMSLYNTFNQSVVVYL